MWILQLKGLYEWMNEALYKNQSIYCTSVTHYGDGMIQLMLICLIFVFFFWGGGIYICIFLYKYRDIFHKRWMGLMDVQAPSLNFECTTNETVTI